MSIATLETQAKHLALSDEPDSVEQYNRVLDMLERKLPTDAFFDFCSNIFGESQTI